MFMKSLLSLATITLVLALVACGTKTPDLKLIMILNCGDNACDINDDGTCEGRGRWMDLEGGSEIAVADTSRKVFKHHEMDDGNYDDVHDSCMFSETIDVKSSARYRITIDKLGPFDITKTTLENQNWAATLEFNN